MLKKSSFILTLLFAIAMIPAYGYTGNTIRTAVPFSFIVAGKVLPAGHYELVQTNARQDNEWMIRNLERASDEALVTAEQETAPEPKLDTYVAFEEINHQHYLSDIWTAGNDDGWHVPVEAEEHMASGTRPKTHRVEATVRSNASS